jgi:hypothetical protein
MERPEAELVERMRRGDEAALAARFPGRDVSLLDDQDGAPSVTNA